MTQQKVKIVVPKDLTPSDRVELAEDIIQFIQTRTSGGVGFRKGRNYRLSEKPYTKEYAQRKGSSRVDLTLTTEMLDSIDLLAHRNGSITVGYQAGSRVNDKAEGNQTGSYGRSPNSKKARPFLGLTLRDLDTLLEDFE